VDVDFASDYIRIFPLAGSAPIRGCPPVVGCETSIRTRDFQTASYEVKLRMISQMANELTAR
jgi:hypothetical protein